MEDLELRWILRTIRMEDGTRVGQHVLQYRRLEGPLGEQWDGPWIDVPIESEQEDIYGEE